MSTPSQYGVLAQAIVQETKHAKLSLEKEKVEAELSSLVKGSEDPIYIVDEGCRIVRDFWIYYALFSSSRQNIFV